MIETSTVVIIGAFAAWFIWNQTTEKHQAQIANLINGLRLYSDVLEQRDQKDKAQLAADLADQLSRGSGVVFHKIKISMEHAAEIEKAIITVTNHDWLIPLGMSEYSGEVQRTRSSLYWLAKQVARRA